MCSWLNSCIFFSELWWVQVGHPVVVTGKLLEEGIGDQLCTQAFLKATSKTRVFHWKNQVAVIGWPGSSSVALRALARIQNYVKLVRSWVEAEYPLCTLKACKK